MRYAYGWDDAGWTEETNGQTAPLRFESREEARAALDAFFAEVANAVAAGATDMEKHPADYRIVEVSV